MTYNLRVSSSGRVQFIPGQLLAEPGTCLLCRRPPRDTNDPFANLQVELEFYGFAYLCVECCTEMADFVGWVAPDKVEVMGNAINESLDRIRSLEEQLHVAKEMIHARIDSAGDRKFDSDGPTSVPVLEVESDSTFIDSILDSNEPEFSESGA